MRRADMLEHADRDDAVERPVDRRGSPGAGSGRGRPSPRSSARRLETACCSSESVTPVTSTPQCSARIEAEAAPARADVEHASCPGCRASLAAMCRFLATCASSRSRPRPRNRRRNIAGRCRGRAGRAAVEVVVVRGRCCAARARLMLFWRKRRMRLRIAPADPRPPRRGPPSPALSKIGSQEVIDRCPTSTS